MAIARLAMIGAAVSLLASAGCSKPVSIPVSEASSTAVISVGAPADVGLADQVPLALLAFADSAEPGEEAADTLKQKPAPRVAKAPDAAEHFRVRMLSFAAEARATAALLEKHGSTAKFDQGCAKLKDLLQRARSADDDDQFEAVIQHANLIWLQLRLGRSYLLQRDEIDGMRSPGAVKLLRDIYRACGQLAQEQQQEIDDLRREVDGK